MSVNWKTGVGRSMVLLVVAFICGVIFIQKAKHFASAAPSERTTTVPDEYMHCQKTYDIIGVVLRGSKYSCNYTFSVDGSSYDGHAYCPQPSADATVYFDPANPSLNSLLDFSVASEQEYREAALWIGVVALIIFFFVFGRLLAATNKRGRGGVVVDARGTVIYPEEIGLGSGSAGLPNPEAANPTPPALREIYLEVVNKIHPDRAANEGDLALRERLMKEANAAFERDDAETLRRVLEEYGSATRAT
jgi:hypothetical protein